MRILILKPSSLGDIVCSLPVAQSIRDQMPDAEISWVAKTRFSEILKRCPTVNGEIIEFDHAPGLRGLLAIRTVMKSLRGKHFDAVLDFQGLLRTGLMTWSAKSPLKVGSIEAREGSRLAYNHVVPLPSNGRESHAIEKLLQFLPTIGLKPELRSPIDIQGDPLEGANSRLSTAGPIVMIPNSRGPHKEWKGFPELTTALLNTSNCPVVVWDSHIRWNDPPLDAPEKFVNLTQKTSLLQLIELLRGASLVVANDSGPLHIAAALGRPTLGLFGPTDPCRFGPYPLHESRNQVLQAPDGDLSKLSSKIVLETVLKIVQKCSPRLYAA
ncbi:MAG TPA: glycosyltransferase family 9 protein [Planctomycetaceae bacterium]|nr:glycosyltransferase family 9 protein [Planctomycetaceae bacterium]